jgi:cell division protein FtsZ
MSFEAPAPEPKISQPAARPIARIVDPSVADDEDEPLFPETPRFSQERPQKSSWLSIFGRPRHDTAPQPQLRTTAASQAQPALEEATDADADLEIPSFLRRLAN